MALSSKQTESKNVRDELAQTIISTLQKLDQEYDALLKNEEGKFISDGARCEMRSCKEEQNLIHVVARGASICHDMRVRWEEKELSNKLFDIQEKIRNARKEKEVCEEKRSIIERRLKVENMKIDLLNEQTKDALTMGENIQSYEKQVQEVNDDFENLSVVKSIWPIAIKKMNEAYIKLQKDVQEMEEELSKYAGLPPDYLMAREKVFELRMQEKELDNRIRELITENRL